MVKKIKKKNTKIAKVKKIKPDENELPKKSIRQNEDKQLFWFLVVIGIVFAVVLGSYLWAESLKSFEYGGVEWVVEKYAEPLGKIYHGRFPSLNNENLIFNIFLRHNPRTNDVFTEGDFSDFKFDGVLSWSDEIEMCRGEVSRAMVDLGSFIVTGIGTGKIETATTNPEVSNFSVRKYVDCSSGLDKTIVVLKKGYSSVVQDAENPYCYVISVADCNDVAPIEKFIVKTISDVGLIKEFVEPAIYTIGAID